MPAQAQPLRTILWLIAWTILAAGCFVAHDRLGDRSPRFGGVKVAAKADAVPAKTPEKKELEKKDAEKKDAAPTDAERRAEEEAARPASVLLLAGVVLAILALCQLVSAATILFLRRRGRPVVEAVMVASIYKIVALVAIVVSLLYGLGLLASVGTALAAFGGMLAGFSLQAPVSGFAAWVLVSLKRPFRPGDRVQFPTLNLTGDVKDIGFMYTVLDQVGGSIGSEEAVGRYILVPNAMLFSQVAINYTVTQEAAYILDEVVVRITFDSDWDEAERILIEAAVAHTGDVTKATGVTPYIRSDMYDYGVYLRLRYQTRVRDRAETAYKISKKIFEDIQHNPRVDLAIPFVYSYRASMRTATSKADEEDAEAKNIRELPLACLRNPRPATELDVIAQLAQSIAQQGLLQPIVVIRDPDGKSFEIVAGHQRFEACRKLGWRTIPAVVREPVSNGVKAAGPAGN
jgi:small-conductance mechanosensitive channel